MTLVDVLGTAAAILTTVSFLPQAVKVLRTRDTAGISLLMYALFTTGVVLWGVYGAILNSAPIVIANVVTFCFAALILAMKVRESLRAARRPTAS